jgi:hypothetical protein
MLRINAVQLQIERALLDSSSTLRLASTSYGRFERSNLPGRTVKLSTKKIPVRLLERKH